MSYIYLGSPYSAGNASAFLRELRYLQAMEHMTGLLRQGFYVYSPIVHCHELAKIADLPKDAAFWKKYNFAMLGSAKEMHVLMLDGWKDSLGLQDEIYEALMLEKHVRYTEFQP